MDGAIIFMAESSILYQMILTEYRENMASELMTGIHSTSAWFTSMVCMALILKLKRFAEMITEPHLKSKL
jgi:hypothetical protein